MKKYFKERIINLLIMVLIGYLKPRMMTMSGELMIPYFVKGKPLQTALLASNVRTTYEIREMRLLNVFYPKEDPTTYLQEVHDIAKAELFRLYPWTKKFD